MAFENLTLFELHLENSRLGPSFGGSGEDEAETEAYESHSDGDDSGGRRIGRSVGALLFVAVVAALAFRRYRSGGEEVEDVDEDSDQITIEHAAEQ